MVAIIDYGVGNLFSLMCSLNYVEIENKLTDDENIIEKLMRARKKLLQKLNLKVNQRLLLQNTETVL